MMRKGRQLEFGYSIIELLVVLAIISILAAVGFNSVSSSSPRAVKAGLIELRDILQQARQLARSSGTDVNLEYISGSSYTINVWPAKLNAAGTAYDQTGQPLMSRKLEYKWFSKVSIVGNATTGFGTETKPVTGVDAIKQLGFTVWDNSNSMGQIRGFSSRGEPQKVVGITRTPSVDGIWVGLKGNSINRQGVPYGVVVVTGRGVTAAYFKSDSILDTQEFQWQRVD